MMFPPPTFPPLESRQSMKYPRADKALEIIAAACHMANRAYCIAMGDESQPTWKDAPEWQKISAIKGVQNALNGSTPEQSHECWLREKQATGWKYGAIKDPEKKEHPCMVPYNDLPPEQKRKDALFLDTVHAIVHAFPI